MTPALWKTVLLAAPFALTAGATGQGTFEQDVRPLLEAKCFDCHGDLGQWRGDHYDHNRQFPYHG